MKKFIMALSILVMGGGGFLGYQNQQTLRDEKELLAVAKKAVTDEQNKLNQLKTDLATATTEKGTAQTSRDQISAKLTETEQQIKRQAAQVMTLEQDLEKMKIERDEITLLVEKAFPPGSPIRTVDELQKALQMLKDQLAEANGKKSTLEGAIQQAQTQMVTAEKQVREQEAYQVDRAKTIALNGLEATVIAVNRNFGFVMVNAGQNLGVKMDSSMLVKRGQERIARLQIKELSPDVLVADVVPSSIAQGVRVLPGDKVIFENTK